MNKQLDFEDLEDKKIYYEDLNAGYYVRFIDYDMINTGYEKVVKIGQIQDKYSSILEIRLNNKLSKIIKTNATEILKYSKNIIDLIEVGDIVRVLVNIKTQETMIFTVDCEADLSLLTEWNIKSIVTKEQFKSIEYEV